MKYVCMICGYVYDEAEQGKPFDELPDDWKCPWCGATKTNFKSQGAEDKKHDVAASSGEASNEDVAPLADSDMRALDAIELSALCSNLAKGCEKQYKPEQAQAFERLATWFGKRAGRPADPSFENILKKVNDDLERGFGAANSISSEHGDRGALRSLTWSEKVSMILKSLLTRYEKEGDAMVAYTGVYVCTICGFVFVGDSLPEVCPVCKVPNHKFEKIGG